MKAALIWVRQLLFPYTWSSQEAHSRTDDSSGETLLQAEEHRHLQKRRRTGTIVSSEPLSSAQSHRVQKDGDTGEATGALELSCVPK